MFCPLLLIALQAVPQAVLSDAACRGDGCAWWLKGENMCAVQGIVRVLAHHMGNIAQNTGKIGG